MQNTPFSTTAGLVWLRRLRHISSVGGASETEQTAVAVAPALPPGPAVVMTWTAAPSRLIASRKTPGSTVRTISGPTAVKAPSMASSGRWSIQLMRVYSAARLTPGTPGYATSSGSSQVSPHQPFSS